MATITIICKYLSLKSMHVEIVRYSIIRNNISWKFSELFWKWKIHIIRFMVYDTACISRTCKVF